MNDDLIKQLQRQNRLLKRALAVGCLAVVALFLTAAMEKEGRARFTEIDVERINVVEANGKPAVVIANSSRLPDPVLNGKTVKSSRGEMPGLIFFNTVGDECGGLIFKGKPNQQGRADAGMHFSMDRFGGDQQLAIGHYEAEGFMQTGLRIFDRGLAKDYEPLYEAYKNAPEGPEKAALREKWKEAGGRQIQRLFVGRTGGSDSAVILADKEGRPRIMITVTPAGEPKLDFLDEKGQVIQSLPNIPKKKP